MGTQPMTGMDDVERQTPHGDTDILKKKAMDATDCWILWIVMVVAVVITASILVPVAYFLVDTHYYVAVDSISVDLNPTNGLSFNLTLGVASRSHGSKACIGPGTYAEVSYGGVQLAASDPAEVARLCAGPGKSAGQRVAAARVTAVPMGHVLDRLTVDMKQGAAVFDVTLHLPAWSYSYDVGEGGDWVSGCNGIRAGAPAVWCDVPQAIAN